MKTHVACIVLIVLSMGLFAVAQETANNTSSATTFEGNAAGPLVTYKTVKTAAPYGTTNYLPVWTSSYTIANSLVYQSGSQVGIGTRTPGATLDVNGTINAATSFNLEGIPFAFGSYNPGNALLGFAGNTTMTGGANTATGAGSFVNNTTGFYNTATGFQALELNTGGSNNTATGLNALAANTTGSYNTASGAFALRSNTGSGNTADGYQALFYNTTGTDNMASGYSALYSNMTGGGNTASGYDALSFNNTGNYNTADGYQALYNINGLNNTGSYNTAIGVSALTSNTTGGYNAAVGSAALYANTTGSENTAVGTGALDSNTTGNDLTCIGYDCTASEDSLSNATAIGAHAVVSASNSLVLGGTGKWAVKVGIGTATPSNVLTIARGAGQPVSDGWETFSSRRWKTNIQTLHDALAKVEQLRGVSYDLKANGQHEVGVIAEEVGAVVPEVVTWEKNGKDAQSVDYGRLTALLIEATKEQQALIHKQQEQIVNLTQQVKTIQATLKANGRNSSAIRTVKTEATTVRQ